MNKVGTSTIDEGGSGCIPTGANLMSVAEISCKPNDLSIAPHTWSILLSVSRYPVYTMASDGASNSMSDT